MYLGVVVLDYVGFYFEFNRVSLYGWFCRFMVVCYGINREVGG